MALTSTIYNLDIQLSHVDRDVYETLALRVARHPSETEEYLLTRILAYCLEYAEGIVFSKGISTPEDPTIAVYDLTGLCKTWIEIGTPDAARLHKAGKAAERVAVYTHKDPVPWLRQLTGEKIHRREALELYEVDRQLVAGLVAVLARRMTFDLSVSDGQIYVTTGSDTLVGSCRRHTLETSA